jgi:hypothetical protein
MSRASKIMTYVTLNKKIYIKLKKIHYFLVKNKRKVVVVDWAATPLRGGLCATLGHFQNTA